VNDSPTAFLYDIHGNLVALEAVLADAEAAGATSYLLGGDYSSMGPWPRETAELLEGLPARVRIRGNVERWLLERPEVPESVQEFLATGLTAAREALGPELVDRFYALPVQAGADLDRAADAERVDALVAGRGRGLRPHRLPAVARLAGRLECYDVGVDDADQFDAPVAVEVGGGTDVRGGPRRGLERRELPRAAAQQHGRRAGSARNQIDGAVVVDVGDDEARAARGAFGLEERRPRPPAVADALQWNMNSIGTRSHVRASAAGPLGGAW